MCIRHLHVSISPPIYLSVYLSIHLSVYSSIFIFIYLFNPAYISEGYTQQRPGGVFLGQNLVPSHQMGFTGQNPIPHLMGFPGQNPMQYQTRFPGQHPIPGQNSIQYGMVHPQNPQWTQPHRPNTSHTPQNYQIKKKLMKFIKKSKKNSEISDKDLETKKWRL